MATDNTNQPTAEAPSPAPQQPQPATPGQGPTPTAAPQNAYQSYQSYGGAYNQYAYNPVAYQPQPYTIPQPAPAVVEENKAWIKAKLVLHGAGIVFGICTLGMGLSYVGGNDGYFAYLAAIACPVPVMCIIWSVLEFIIQAVYKFKKGVPPGGQVAATLIIWLAAAIVGPLEGVFAGLDDGESCDYTYNGRYYEETNCYDPWSGKRKMWVAITALTCLLAVIYFALFVRACIDTARYNRARNRPIMVVNPAAYWGPPNNGWQAVPQGNYIPMEQPSAQPQPQPQTPGQYFMPTPQPAAVPASQVDEKGKGVEQPANTVREFYTPGQAS